MFLHRAKRADRGLTRRLEDGLIDVPVSQWVAEGEKEALREVEREQLARLPAGAQYRLEVLLRDLRSLDRLISESYTHGVIPRAFINERKYLREEAASILKSVGVGI